MFSMGNFRNYIIYKITNQVDGKIYIGRTTQSIKKRWAAHRGGIEAKKNIRLRLYCAMKEFGKEVFSIEQIDTAESFEELKEKEKYYIIKLNSHNPDIGYNMSIDTDEGLEVLDEDSINKRISSLHSSQARRRLGKYGLGVRKTRGLFYANISFKTKQYNIRCGTHEEAKKMFDKLAIYFHGENAVTNNPIENYSQKDIEDIDILVKNYSQRKTSSGFWGITLLRNKFCASIWDGKNHIFLGTFDKEDDAAITVDKARFYLFGEKSDHFNYPEKIESYGDRYSLKTWFDNLTINRRRGLNFDRRIEKYGVRVCVDNKMIGLGYYEDPVEAAIIRDMAIIYFNIKEQLNYPEKQGEYINSASDKIKDILFKKKKYHGVYYVKKKRHYRSTIIVDGISHYLGSYKTDVEAAKAYNEGAQRLLGEKAKLNIIDS